MRLRIKEKTASMHGLRLLMVTALLGMWLISGCVTTIVPPTPSGAAQTQTPGTLTPFTRLELAPPDAQVAQYGLWEAAIQTDGAVANLYDPAQASLSVRFSAPSGVTVTVPAFWYQPFDPATLTPQGEPGWRVRFTPQEAGTWQAQALLAQPALASAPLTFNVEADPTARGFLRVDPAHPRHFAFDNGDYFLPIGLNMAWSEQAGLAVLADYTRWLDALSANGGNYIRLWMPAWGFGIEWNDTGLGDYTGRMQQAWLLDQVFRLAEARGVYIMLALINHGQFSTSVNPEWADNPYNAANGGMLQEPSEFATNAEAKALFARRLRYIAARWAYSPHLHTWEWWNEVNWTPIGDARLQPWIEEMTPLLRQWDPYGHPISNSYGSGGKSQLWAMPELDFAQWHDYTGSDPMLTLPAVYADLLALAGGAKPVMLSEIGYGAAGVETQFGKEEIHFHNALWAGPFSGFASSGMYWWWDQFVDAKQLWGDYAGLAEFLQGEDLRLLAPSQAQVTGAEGAGAAYALALLAPDRALVWVRNAAYHAAEVDNAILELVKAKQRIDPETWVYLPPLLQGFTLTVDGLADGAYTAQVYDPQARVWLEPQRVDVTGGQAVLALPDFAADLAIKLAPVE